MADATGAATAALAGSDNTAPTPTPTPSATPTAAPTPSAEPWTKGWDQADAGFVEKKGWKGPQDLFKSYRELETKLGADKLPLPKDENDADGWNQVFARLGRPDSPDKYQFPKGVDEATVKALAPELHKLGLTQKQVAGLAALDLGRAETAIAAQKTAWLEDQDKAMKTLESEWGAKMPEEIEYNRRAMKAIGLSIDQANAMMAAAGPGGTERLMRLLNLAGRSMREDNAGSEVDESRLGFGMTPNRAAAELQEHRTTNSPLWQKYQKGDKAATAAIKRLYRIQSGERA